MNTTFTNYATKAKQFLNLLQGYTKGIRITAILILLLMGVSNAWASGGIGYKGVKFTKNDAVTGWYNIHNVVSWEYADASYECRSGKSGVTDFNNADLGIVTSLKLHSFVVIGWTDNSDWVSGQLKYRTYLQSASAGDYNVYNVGNYETYCNATDVLVTSGNNRVVGKNGTMDVTLVDNNTTPGKYYLQLQGMGRMRWCNWEGNQGDFNSNNGSEVKASYTVPGFTKTTASQDFGSVGVRSNSSKTISFTNHYGTKLTTSNCVLSGTNKSEFSVTSISETGVTVEFTPSSVGSKSATLTITDAHQKKCVISLSGTGVTPTYSYTVTAGEGGTVSPASGTVAQGSGVTITATPDDGYEFDKWTATNGTLDNESNASTTFTPSANNANATASFKVACTQTPTTPTSLTAKVGGNALTGAVCSGTNVTLTAGGTISIGSLQWGTGTTVGDNIIDAGNGRSSITVSPTVTTTYWVRAIITEAGDCYGVTSEAKTLQINITPALVQPVLSESTLTLEEGGSTGTITVTSGTTGGTWTSSNQTVATVNNGTVTPKSPGTATITYSVSNGCEADKAATCTVTVTAKPYYIAGRLQQKWDPNSKAQQFTYVSNGQYKYETGKTVAELSVGWSADNNYLQYFFIHTGSGLSNSFTSSGNNGHNFHQKLGYANALTLSSNSENNEAKYIKFADATDNSSDVVIWWEPSTKKLWYTATANLTTNLYLLGLGNWTQNDSRRFVKDENDPTKAKVIINLAKGEYTKNTDDGFKINDNVASKWYGNDGTMKRNSCTGWDFTVGANNAGLTADVAGDYVFTLDLTNMKLSVTYPEAYKVTFSKGTGGKTVTAKVGEVAITSGDYVLKGKSVVFTQEAETGYTFSKWTNGSSTTLSTDPSYTCTVNADVTVKAEFTENTTNVTIDANDGSLGTLKVNSAAQNWGYSTSVGVATTKSIAATPKDNSYEFTGWTLTGNVTTSDDTKKTTITIKGNGNSGSGTVTANFQKIVRTITFDREGGEDGTETLTATYGEATTPITPPTKTGYTFRGYWTGDNGTGTQIVNTDGTWIASKVNFTDANNKWIVTSNKTLYAKWEENLTTITIETSPSGAGALKVGGNDFTAGNTTTVGITTSRTVVASNTDGFTFKEWQKSDNITITSGSLTSLSITIKGNGNGGAGTLTAVYDEDLSTPYVFKGGTAFGGDDWKEEYPLTKRPGESNVKIGYVTFNITGINTDGSKRAYQFKIKKGNTWYGLPADGNWWYKREHSTEARSLSSSAGDIGLITDMAGVYTIKVDYTNESDPKLTVSYPSTEFYLLGFGNADSYWEEDESKKFSVDAGIATITKTLTAGTHEFKIEEKVNNNEIWRTSSTTITRANNANIDFSNTTSGADNAKITADVAGTYTFKYDIVNQKLTVIYPSKLTLTDGPATSVSSATTSNPLTTVPGQTITATPTITSTGTKAFCWGLYTDAECTDGKKVDNITFTSLGAGKVSFALPEVEKPYYLKLTIHPDADCKQDPEETIIAPINATTENFIFFKKNISASKWNDVYVNFYNGSYWDNQGKGSGNSNNMISANNKMTQIKGTNIFYFNYSGIIPGNVVSFVNQSGNYDNFHMCQVVYREDMKLDCAPMFVSRDYIQSNNYINNSEYYEGYWTTFAPDVDAKHTIQIDNGGGAISYSLTSTTPTRTYTLTQELSAKTTVHFYLKNACYTTTGYGFYGVYGEMDVKNCTNWVMYHGHNNIALKTRSAGEYTFIVSFLDNGEIRVSVEYPLMEGDYQLIYKDSDNRPHPSDYVRNRANGEDIVSLYINKEKSPTVTLQQWDGNKWNVKKGAYNQPITVDLSPITDDGTMTSGVYNFKITQPAEGDITSNEAIEVQGRYLGYYYIRTNSAEGKWKTYKMDSHKMTYSAYADENEDFTHYFCEFLGDNKSGSEDFIGTHDDDISFAIACDYAKALTDTLEGDTYTNGLNLYESASVRFMYNTHTNGLRRAYLKGRHESTDYLKLTKGEGNMTLNEGGEPINEITFEDEGNWIYSIDVYVTPEQINDAYTFSGTLTAKYPINTDISLNTQYFYATPGQDTNSDGIPDSYSHKQIIGGSDGAQLKVAIRYDFKTNRLMRAWKPTDEITDDLPIAADILLIRKGQDAATQIRLSSGTEITDVQTIYGAIQFDYNDVVGKVTSWNSHAYEFGRYYVSFPFDVAVSDIFGFGTLNENWQIQRYNGQKRADIGWFAETSTFWEPMQETEVMNANEGYILALDRRTLNGDNNVMWQNKEAGSSVYLYFPSSSATKTIANGTQTIHVPAHQCNIDREFQVENGTKTVNHQNTDSHWNVIGSPLFENKVATQIAEGPETEHPDDVYPADTKLRYFYKWQYEEGKENTYAVSAAFNTDHAFLTMHGYMVQFEGDVIFEGASITPPASVAARRVAENKQNYTVELQLYNEDIEASRTYVELRENAIDSFLLSEDLYMIRSSHFADVFTYAGTYDVAANVLSVNSHIVPVGVQVKKAGTYTFSMTTPFDGTVTLIDYHTGSRTNLGWSDYTVTLEKGTINERFALEINIQNVSTDVEGNTGHFKGKDAVKFLHNGILYIKKGDAIYDARGSRVSMSYEL